MNSAPIELSFATIFDNLTSDGQTGGVHDATSSVIASNTIIANNRGTIPDLGFYNCSRGLTGAYNLQWPAGAGDCNSVTSFATADPRLGPRGTYGGSTPLYPLLAGSPAINMGDPEFIPPAGTDQRGAGFPRVEAGRVDIGAFEAPDALVVDSNADGPDQVVGDGVCATATSQCTLRAAIQEANASAVPRAVIFSTTQPITPASALPPIATSVTVDGGATKTVLESAPGLNGSNGLSIAGSGSIITNMEIRGFDGAGIRLQGNGNRVEANSIHGNTGAGISVSSGAGNRITHNSIHDNGGLGIELGSGVTAIHKGPPGAAYPNNAQNYPVLFNAISAGGSTG